MANGEIDCFTDLYLLEIVHYILKVYKILLLKKPKK
jgi:hypothetical protein